MITFGRVVPVLRIFDADKAREFYLDFLGFSVDFEHRFGDNSPLYMGVTQSGTTLHLSEHYGDATPGAQVRIEVSDVVAYVGGLAAKHHRYAKPGTPRKMPWGSLEITLTDPFGNRLTLVETGAGTV